MIAEINTLRWFAWVLFWLQWGRDQMIAEIDSQWEFMERVARASMGPRSDDRGNGNAFHAYRRAYVASMGPRSDDRGNVKRVHGSGVAREALQWGRDQMIAEIEFSSTIGLNMRTLQWGRDQMIAEMGVDPWRDEEE